MKDLNGYSPIDTMQMSFLLKLMKKLFYDMPHHLFDTFFGCPELKFNEMSWHLSTNPFSPPPIKLPFPPPITAQDIVLKRPSSKICSRSPNAFFIYRKAYFD